MDDSSTYDVRVYRTDVYKGAKVTTYRVRWKTGHRHWREGFRNAALADSFRSSLMTAAGKGEAFSLSTGRPMSWQRTESALTWCDLVLDYVAAKWPYATPNHRKSIAEGLTDATEAMLASDQPPPYPADEIRRALITWAFSDRLRGAAGPPEDLAAIVRWLQTATVPVPDLIRPGTGAVRCRSTLERISRKQDGTAAAANTANRKRAVLNNLMQYAVETGALPANPLKTVKWTRPRTLKTVDPRTVVNSDQARRLLVAVGQQGERGERMVAFFGCMYYAALRPEEAVELRPENLARSPRTRLGRADPDRLRAAQRHLVDRQRLRAAASRTKAPPTRRNPAGAHPSRAGRAPEPAPEEVPARPRWPHPHRPSRRHLQRPRIPRDLSQGPRCRVQSPRVGLATGQAPL